jgi:hypothetical protein
MSGGGYSPERRKEVSGTESLEPPSTRFPVSSGSQGTIKPGGLKSSL